MSLTLPELERIRDALMHEWYVDVDYALEIVRREIHQMEQDQLLSESEANPT